MYKIGKVNIVINQYNGFKDLVKFDDFKCDDNNVDVKYNIFFQDSLPKLDEEHCIYINQLLAVESKDNKYRFFHMWNNEIYAVVDDFIDRFDIYLYNVSTEFHPYLIPNLLRLEKSLLRKESFILHSSYISYENQALLFTGPSGIGKSTQADLWKKCMNAEILNGDRNIVGKEKDNWYVYGSPISGSSEYCINRTTPLKAIIILRKSTIDKVERLDIQGFNQIFSQVTVNPWDKEFCNKMMDLIMNACVEIPIYLYFCTKEDTAVQVLYDKLKKDGVIDGSF